MHLSWLACICACITFQMQSTGDREDPVYDTVEEMHIGKPLASVENRPSKARR